MRQAVIMRAIACAIGLLFGLSANNLPAQVFPPGTFQIDGIPVSCGPVAFVLTPAIGDVGISNMQGQIFLNPFILQQLPTVLKLYWVAHECGHYNAGPNEIAADCWAVRTGRNQGWFAPQAFQALMAMFQNNPGDIRHPSGPNRVAAMMQCYATP
jgi:hypothetical protein